MAAFTGCGTIQKIDNDTTPLEIIQMAQTAYDHGLTKKSLMYYDELIKRYGMYSDVYIEARYEIGHIYYKKKKYKKAREILEEIVEIYNSSQPGELPGAFKKMAALDLEKIDRKQKKHGK